MKNNHKGKGTIGGEIVVSNLAVVSKRPPIHNLVFFQTVKTFQGFFLLLKEWFFSRLNRPIQHLNTRLSDIWREYIIEMSHNNKESLAQNNCLIILRIFSQLFKTVLKVEILFYISGPAWPLPNWADIRLTGRDTEQAVISSKIQSHSLLLLLEWWWLWW